MGIQMQKLSQGAESAMNIRSAPYLASAMPNSVSSTSTPMIMANA